MKSSENQYQRDFKESIIPDDISLQGRFCPRPFEHVEIMHGFGPKQDVNYGEVYSCCAGWLPKSIGNYLQDDLQTIWNSPAAVEIRESILDGSFKFCNKQACTYIQSNNLFYNQRLPARYQALVDEQKTTLADMPSSFFLCYDRSCNLTCKSCRNNLILFKDGEGLSNPLKLNQKLMRDLFSVPTARKINLKITGSGDPFASPAFQDLLTNLDGRNFPGLEIELYTNGLLFTPHHWDKLQHIQPNITLVSVSIDAASEETYRHTRGGNWNQLLHNLFFIAQLRMQKKIRSFATNYVVQTKNYFEVPAFIKLCMKYHIDRINFSFISDWSTWTKEEFQEQCIWRPDHPHFAQLLTVLKNPLLDEKIAVLGPLAAYRQMALPEVIAGLETRLECL